MTYENQHPLYTVITTTEGMLSFTRRKRKQITA